jgi:hypothetical protein
VKYVAGAIGLLLLAGLTVGVVQECDSNEVALYAVEQRHAGTTTGALRSDDFDR